jgi:hypothetical protein
MTTPGDPKWSLKEISRVARHLEKARGPGDLMKISLAAHITGLHPDTIRRWIREGRVKSWGYRGTLRVDPRDLLPERDKEGSQ